MRTYALPICLLLLLLLPGSSAFGQSCDMKVHLSTGETVTISSADILRIEFADVTLGVPTNTAQFPGTIQFLRTYPNPFKPSTAIEYRVASRADVRIRVFDLNGALVKELLNENVAAGEHRVTWDGTDKNHARVSSGIYFFRVECAAKAISGRLILVK
jgi:hypothetical protein